MSTLLGWAGPHWLAALAAAMTMLVMIDAFIGHYRSGFDVPAQYIPFIVGGCILVAVTGALVIPRQWWIFRALSLAGWIGVVSGTIGVAYHHYYGITAKPGGYDWLLHHLLHHAPPLAPFALSALGALVIVAAEGFAGRDTVFGVRLSTAVLAIVALTLVGAAVQASLLHYRGAFNNPLMYAPLTAPLIGAAATSWQIVAPSREAFSTTATLLWATVLVGFVGLGMHLRGFDRTMGGLHMGLAAILDGPAMTAPVLFSGFAAAGLIALYLL